MDMSTTYNPGSVSTTTTAAANPNSAVMDALRGFLLDRINRLRAGGVVQQAAPPQARLGGAAPSARAFAPSGEVHNDARPSAADQELAYMEKRRRILDDISASQTAPQRFLPSGPGITGGYVSDPGAMSGDQRRMFLPQGSSIQGRIGDPGVLGEYPPEDRGPWGLG